MDGVFAYAVLGLLFSWDELCSSLFRISFPPLFLIWAWLLRAHCMGGVGMFCLLNCRYSQLAG